MSLQSAIFPWPWTLHQSNDYEQPSFTIKAANGTEVAHYEGLDARTKAEVIMELAAEKAVTEVLK